MVFSVTLLSRLGGLLREVLIARVLGATIVGSAFTFAFTVPNLFRRLFGEGALSAAFVPEYAQLTKHAPDSSHVLATRTIRWLFAITLGITFAVFVGIWLTLWLVPPTPERTLSLQLMAVMIFFMPPVCVAAILASMLLVHGRFGPASSGPVVLNTFMVAVGLYYFLRNQQGTESTAFVLAAATVLSGVTQCVSFTWILRTHVRWLRPDQVSVDAAQKADEAGRRMLRKFGAVVIGVGTLQLNALVDQMVAMWPNLVGPTIFGVAYPLQTSSNILIANAQRLYQFPLGVFGIAVASAIFPLLSLAADEPGKFESTLKRGVRMSLLLGLPASVGLCLVKYDLCFVLYGGKGARGYSVAEVLSVASVLFGYAPAVWAYSLNHVFTRAFYSKGDTTTPMRVSLVMVLANFLLSIALIWPLKEAGTSWATTIAATIQCAILGGLLWKLPGGRSVDAHGLRGIGKILIASTVMAVACGLILSLWPQPLAWGEAMLRLCALCGAGVLTFGVMVVMLRIEEVKWLLARTARKQAEPTGAGGEDL